MKKTATVTYTHKGWMGLCPIYAAGLGTEFPAIDARHWSLEWLHELSLAIYGFGFSLMSLLNPAFEPAWPIRITGELKPPVTITHTYVE